MTWNEVNGSDSKALERIADALDPPEIDEAKLVRAEQYEALRDTPPEQRYAVACRMFLRFIPQGMALCVNPEYQPTRTMARIERRAKAEQESHRRALEIARASAPVINIHNELPRRGWFR
jgi:hypothetical protein